MLLRQVTSCFLKQLNFSFSESCNLLIGPYVCAQLFCVCDFIFFGLKRYVWDRERGDRKGESMLE